MDAQKLLKRAWRAYRGKVEEKTPSFGSDKADLVIDIANQAQEEWARNSKIHWNSLFEERNIGIVDTSVFTYELDDDFLFPSDYIIIEQLDGNRREIPITKPQKRNDNKTKVYLSGNNPKKITFAGDTIDSVLNGGTILMPGYYLPSEIVNSTDLVTADDPNWLVYATAAELTRNDPAKEDQYANLIGKANDLYLNMITANEDSGYRQDNTMPTIMPTVGDMSGDMAFED